MSGEFQVGELINFSAIDPRFETLEEAQEEARELSKESKKHNPQGLPFGLWHDAELLAIAHQGCLYWYR